MDIEAFGGRITYFSVPGHLRREQAFIGVASCILTFRAFPPEESRFR
jgi:hypothetical protein